MTLEFRHEPLKLSADSIRLLQVQSGTKNDFIRIRITQYALHRRPPYIAISYAWGDSKDLRKIYVNGRPFSIQQNLWHLLYHLRARGESSFLWVDALTIDQRNLEERNFHVHIMSQIYDRADSTIVWLGLPSNDRWEARAMDFIKEMSAYSKINFKDLYLTLAQQQRWNILVQLCRCVYWTRTWIIQEFLRARKIEVLCGTANLHWDCFEVVVGIIIHLYSEDAPPISAITELMQTIPFRLTKRRMFHQHSSLRELLHEFPDSQCAEPRDKVYGILGIADDCGEHRSDGVFRGPQPDYSKHVLEVYFEVMVHLQENSSTHTIEPTTALLLQKSLKISHEQLHEYTAKSRTSIEPSDTSSTITFPLAFTPITLIPDYINIITDVLPSYTSIRDLRQILENFDWSRYLDFEVPRKQRRPSLSTSKFSSFPTDLIPKVINAATNASNYATAANSMKFGALESFILNQPNTTSFSVLPDQISLHPEDQKRLNNPSLANPRIIIEQSNGLAETIRVGFACTDVRKGDFIVHFKGLDLAFIARLIHEGVGRGGFRIVGSGIMITHSGLQERQMKTTFQAEKAVVSGCLGSYHCEALRHEGMREEDLHFKTDPVSLCHLLMNAI